MGAAAQRCAGVHRDVQLQFLQPQAALQKVVYSREQRPPVGPVQLRAVRGKPPGEWVSARQALWALRQLGRPQALVVSG